MSGDGIYSRHLTHYPSPGRYVFTLTVTDNNNTASVLSAGEPIYAQPQDLPIPICCGSSIHVPLARRQATGHFIRTVAGPVVDFATVEMDKSIFPPSKIGDLEVTYDNKEYALLASWTAPGGDYRDGEVTGYHVVYSASIDSLLGPLREDTELKVISRSDRAGAIVEHRFNIHGVQGAVYVGIRAEDSSGNLGKISNLVFVNIPSRPVNTDPENQPSATSMLSETNWVVIGCVLGIILVIFLSLLALLVCWLCRTRKRCKPNSLHGFNTKSSGVNVHIPSPAHSVSTNAISYNSEHKLSNLPLVPPMSRPPPSSTSFANNITPTYWSASQLLAEHEQRVSSGQEDPFYYVTSPELDNHLHLSDYDHPQNYFYDPRNNYSFDNQIVIEEQFGDYSSDLADEALEVNTTKSVQDLNMSDESSSTILQGSIASQCSSIQIMKNITQV